MADQDYGTQLAIEQEKTRRALLQQQQREQAETARAAREAEKAERDEAIRQQRLFEKQEAEQRATQRKAEQQAEAERQRRQKAAEAAEKARQAARQKAQAAEAARVKSARAVNVPISPSAAQIQLRRESPFAGVAEGGFWQTVAAYLAGTGMVAVLTTMLPKESRWVGPLIGGMIGGVTTMTSPMGTWLSEAGQGALSSAATYGMIAAIGHMSQASPPAST